MESVIKEANEVEKEETLDRLTAQRRMVRGRLEEARKSAVAQRDERKRALRPWRMTDMPVFDEKPTSASSTPVEEHPVDCRCVVHDRLPEAREKLKLEALRSALDAFVPPVPAPASATRKPKSRTRNLKMGYNTCPSGCGCDGGNEQLVEDRAEPVVTAQSPGRSAQATPETTAESPNVIQKAPDAREGDPHTDDTSPIKNRTPATPNHWLIEKLFNSSCLLYTSPSPRDRTRSRMPSSA